MRIKSLPNARRGDVRIGLLTAECRVKSTLACLGMARGGSSVAVAAAVSLKPTEAPEGTRRAPRRISGPFQL
jgi:hypothetical protein